MPALLLYWQKCATVMETIRLAKPNLKLINILFAIWPFIKIFGTSGSDAAYNLQTKNVQIKNVF